MTEVKERISKTWQSGKIPCFECDNGVLTCIRESVKCDLFLCDNCDMLFNIKLCQDEDYFSEFAPKPNLKKTVDVGVKQN